MARARGAIGGRAPPSLAPWIPNIVLGAVGVALLIWRARSADQPIRISVPDVLAPRAIDGGATGAGPDPPRAAPPLVVVIRIPHLNLPWPRLLDLYISRQYLSGLPARRSSRCSGSSTSRRSSIWPTSCSAAPRRRPLLLQVFLFPDAAVRVLRDSDVGVLVATLVTVGADDEEQRALVMRACGISLYRSALPLLLFARAGQRRRCSACRSRCSPERTREADRLNGIIRGFPAPDARRLNRRWMVGQKRRHLSLRLLRSAHQSIHAALDRYRLDAARGGWRADVCRQRVAGDGEPAQRGPRSRRGMARAGRLDARVRARRPAGKVADAPWSYYAVRRAAMLRSSRRAYFKTESTPTPRR